MSEDFWAGAEIIHVYTRAQALADGVLVDVTEAAREAGFTIPAALTIAAWVDCVKWTREDEHQDESGRLWDVLYMALMAARRRGSASQLDYTLVRIPNEGRGYMPTPVTLRMHVGPGDDGEPVLTIGFASDF